MDLVTPAIGLVFWTTVVFLFLLLILKKYAWKPIINAVNDRNNNIESALKAAEKAKKQLEELKASNEDLLRQAREERDRMLKEAHEVKEGLIAEAKNKAREEADKMIGQAREAIESERSKALAEIRNQVADISIEIAEKILKENLSSDDAQKNLAEKYLNELNLN